MDGDQETKEKTAVKHDLIGQMKPMMDVYLCSLDLRAACLV